MNLQPDGRMNTLAASPRTAEVVLGDLDALLCAVKARLRSLANGADRPAAPVMAEQADAHLRRGVLECVDALGQVHVMLAQEIAHRGRLEQLVIDAAAVLSRASPELVAGLGLTLCVPAPVPMPGPMQLQVQAPGVSLPPDRLQARA